MIDAVAPGQLGSVSAVAIVAGLLFSLLALCCCVDVDPPVLGVGDAADVASVHAQQESVTDAAGHVDPDCAQSSTSDVAMLASVHSVPAAASDPGFAAVEAAPEAGPPPGGRLSPPVPQLLCVMRT